MHQIKEELAKLNSKMMQEMPKVIQSKFLMAKTSSPLMKQNYESMDELCSSLSEISLSGLKFECENEKHIK